jgi:hypothetical protein
VRRYPSCSATRGEVPSAQFRINQRHSNQEPIGRYTYKPVHFLNDHLHGAGRISTTTNTTRAPTSSKDTHTKPEADTVLSSAGTYNVGGAAGKCWQRSGGNVSFRRFKQREANVSGKHPYRRTGGTQDSRLIKAPRYQLSDTTDIPIHTPPPSKVPLAQVPHRSRVEQLRPMKSSKHAQWHLGKANVLL